MTDSPRFTCFGRRVPHARLGWLRESRPDEAPDRLRARLEEDGYLLLRRAISAATTIEARRAVLERLAAVGEIVSPVAVGIPTGESNRPIDEPARSAFWKSVCDDPALRQATHGDAMRRLVAQVCGRPMVPHDYIFLRVAVPGRATSLHCDYPFFARTTERVWTSWIALGPVTPQQGPIFVVEGSHHFADHVDGMRGFDLARAQGTRRATIAECAIAFAEARETRLLTASFDPGDVLLFNMFLIHGAFDHSGGTDDASAGDATPVRVSCDARWQPEADPRDPRYFGADPGGTFGGGYGELNGAKPLNVAWHQR